MNYPQVVFYAPHPKVDPSLSSVPLGETRVHVSNIALGESEFFFECVQSAFIADPVAVSLCAKPDLFEGLVNWVPSGRWRDHNCIYIFCQDEIKW